MRSILSFLTVLLFLTIAARGQAQSTYPGAATRELGYYVPVIATENGFVPAAGYSMNVSDVRDSEEPESPMVSADVGGGCGCAECTGRIQSECYGNCNCSSCFRDRILSRSFGSLEYLFWYNKGISLPALVTSNNGAVPPQVDAGVLGLPTTSVLFGNEGIDNDQQNGARLSFGWWLDDCCNLAIGAKLYGVEGGALYYSASSAGNPVLGRPFFNTDPTVNGEDALLVAYPGVSSGTVSVLAENDVFGTEIFGRSLLDATDRYRVDLIGGYQFNRIDSDLLMSSVHSTGVSTFTFNDLVAVQNHYHAGMAGLAGEVYRGCFTYSALGKIALGNMRENVYINGSNTVVAGGTVTTAGGLYTQPTNIGLYKNDELVWSPEFNLKVSCAVTQRLSVSVGYTFMYFTRVAFAGDQIDRNINATQLNGGALVGPAQPAFNLRDSAFWIQTLDLGLAFSY